MKDVYVGDRVIYACQPESQGRVVEVRTRATEEPSPPWDKYMVIEIQVEWDDDFDDTNDPWWDLEDFIIARKPR